MNDYGIPVLILKRDNSKYGKLIKRYLNFDRILEEIAPDVIFFMADNQHLFKMRADTSTKNIKVSVYVLIGFEPFGLIEMFRILFTT